MINRWGHSVRSSFHRDPKKTNSPLLSSLRHRQVKLKSTFYQLLSASTPLERLTIKASTTPITLYNLSRWSDSLMEQCPWSLISWQCLVLNATQVLSVWFTELTTWFLHTWLLLWSWDMTIQYNHHGADNHKRKENTFNRFSSLWINNKLLIFGDATSDWSFLLLSSCHYFLGFNRRPQIVFSVWSILQAIGGWGTKSQYECAPHLHAVAKMLASWTSFIFTHASPMPRDNG